MFNWRPYDSVFHLLPGFCLSGQGSRRCEMYLVFWEIVEPHLPSRVMRQFRMFLPIPVNTLIDEQEHRRLHRIKFTESCVASPEYIQWYLPRTIIYTIDPRHHHQNQHGFPNDGGTLQMTWDIMSQIYQRLGEDFIRDMASQAMGYGQVHHHMGYYPTHMSQDPVGYQVPLMPQSTLSQHLSQFSIQNYEDAGPSGYNPLENYNMFQSPAYSQDIQQDFLSPSLVNPFYRQLDTPPTPAFHHLQNVRPQREHSLSLELDMFDLNSSMDYTNEANDDNENLANRRGRRQIRRPGCGTH
ncbi:hypothetical protein E3N88_15462 [Mikania micrantha]|uniref:Aminotransferase-like plant mobile domain-containing protein n=1 Tax=Mikania micrantha TaxID=192012 RepID=A0A5N6NW26_9ASTR|nr:hypothetical protein E3N88_15462 [Mikania micrantha]